MRAKNNKEVTRAYWRFSGYLGACIIVGILAFFTFLRTSATEVYKIVEKTNEYDKIYTQQLDLVNEIDQMYEYISKLNTNLNDVQIQNVVNRHRMDISKSMEKMNSKDVRLFQKLIGETTTFLQVKDSIRSKRDEERSVRDDLQRCIDKNNQLKKDIAFGRLGRR